MPEGKSLRQLLTQAVEDRGICDACPWPSTGSDLLPLWPDVGVQPTGAVLAIPALWRLKFYDNMMERDPEMARQIAEVDPIIDDLLRERAKGAGKPDVQ